MTSDFEEVSLRDIVCWRIENDYTSLGSISFEFDVELVSCLPHEETSRFLSECTKEDMNYEESVLILVDLSYLAYWYPAYCYI